MEMVGLEEDNQQENRDIVRCFESQKSKDNKVKADTAPRWHWGSGVQGWDVFI